MPSLGLTSESGSVDNLVAGEIRTLSVDIKASAGAMVRGQVLQFNTTSNAFEKYTSGSSAVQYAVLADDTLADDAAAQKAIAIVWGEVSLAALDATAQADAEIRAALGSSGIRVRDAVV